MGFGDFVKTAGDLSGFNIAAGAVDNTFGTNIMGPNATDKAIKAQQDATREANATQRYMYDQTRKDLNPWRETGERALGDMESGDFVKSLEMDPGFQFRMNEGIKALEASAAARGGLNSGRTLKDLTRFSQDYASQEYGNAYNREFNRLSQLAGFGGSGLGMTVQSGQNYANNVSNNQVAMGNAAASANIAQANRTAGFLGQGMMAGGMAYGGGAQYSDRRLKTDIREISEADMAELRSVIKPYQYQYAMNEMGPGEWIGVMAQDLEKTKLGKTVVFEDALGRKLVDQRKLLAMLIASFGKGAA